MCFFSINLWANHSYPTEDVYRHNLMHKCVYVCRGWGWLIWNQMVPSWHLALITSPSAKTPDTAVTRHEWGQKTSFDHGPFKKKKTWHVSRLMPSGQIVFTGQFLSDHVRRWFARGMAKLQVWEDIFEHSFVRCVLFSRKTWKTLEQNTPSQSGWACVVNTSLSKGWKPRDYITDIPQKKCNITYLLRT